MLGDLISCLASSTNCSTETADGTAISKAVLATIQFPLHARAKLSFTFITEALTLVLSLRPD